METAQKLSLSLSSGADRRSRRRTAAGGALRHAARHAPRAAPHGARLHGSRTRRRGAAGAAQQPRTEGQRFAVRSGLRRRGGARPAAARRDAGQGRPHGLCDDQLVLAEEGRGSLRGGAFAPAGQEYARNRRIGDRQARLSARYGDQLRARTARRRPSDRGRDEAADRDGFGGDALCGRGRGRFGRRRAEGDRRVAARGQKPPVGAGVQRRSGRLRRGDRPAEPEGCTCLRPAARAGICDGSGFRSGAAPDARRGEGGTRKRRFGQAGAGVERGAGAPAGRTRRFAGRGRGAPPCRGVAARRRDGERRGG